MAPAENEAAHRKLFAVMDLVQTRQAETSITVGNIQQSVDGLHEAVNDLAGVVTNTAVRAAEAKVMATNNAANITPLTEHLPRLTAALERFHAIPARVDRHSAEVHGLKAQQLRDEAFANGANTTRTQIMTTSDRRWKKAGQVLAALATAGAIVAGAIKAAAMLQGG